MATHKIVIFEVEFLNIFVAVVSGVTIFVIGQFFLKLVLDPIVEFKKSIAAYLNFCYVTATN